MRIAPDEQYDIVSDIGRFAGIGCARLEKPAARVMRAACTRSGIPARSVRRTEEKNCARPG